MKEIWNWGPYKIVEVVDENWDIEDILGDSYCPKANPEIDLKELKRQEKDERERVAREGVYGYRLIQCITCESCQHTKEIEIYSCYGFVGQYTKGDAAYDHYIVHEMKQLAGKRQRIGL